MLVLIVVSDPTPRALIAEFLREAGLGVMLASDGAQALGLLAGGLTPQAAVVDLGMPISEARSLVRRLRRHPTPVPILVLSRQGARRLRMKLGADAALEEPFDPAVLLAMLRGLTARRQVAEAG